MRWALVRALFGLLFYMLCGAPAQAADPMISIVAGALGSPCTEIPCGDGGLATDARLYLPSGMAVDSNGNIYIAEFSHHRVRRIDKATGIITTFAGQQGLQCTEAPCGDGGLATSARLNGVRGVATDSAGNVYIADSSNHAIRKVDITTGIISTVVGTIKSLCAASPCGDGGLATQAQLISPTRVALNPTGTKLYIADYSNSAIRQVDLTTGIITTVAGTQRAGCNLAPCGDGGPATSAQLYLPSAVAFDSAGDLYIADYGNQ